MKPAAVFLFLINLYLIQLVRIVGVVSRSIPVLCHAFVDSCHQQNILLLHFYYFQSTNLNDVDSDV